LLSVEFIFVSFLIIKGLSIVAPLLSVDVEPQFARLGPDHHRLIAHSAHHVKGLFGLSPERQLLQITFDAALDDLS